MKMIVGLGNPGEKYLRTRHNLGFMVIDEFFQQLGMGGFQHKFKSLFCKKEVEHEEIILLKPQTFMNLSGIAVQEVANMYKCQTRDIMVICDDLDLPFGKLRIRRAGGCGPARRPCRGGHRPARRSGRRGSCTRRAGGGPAC